VCFEYATAIEVTNVLFPEGIKPNGSFILLKSIRLNETEDLNNPIFEYASPIGISCGCYAMAHRQLAHIQTRMAARATQAK